MWYDAKIEMIYSLRDSFPKLNAVFDNLISGTYDVWYGGQIKSSAAILNIEFTANHL